MSDDARLFAYPLDPPLQRLRWRLDEQLAALSKALAALETLRAECATLAADAEAAAADLAGSRAQRINPGRDRHALDYLANLHRRHASAQHGVREAERGVGEQRETLAATQREIEQLERDRAACLADHLRDTHRRAQRETDQDWIARAAWRASGSEVQP